MRIIVFVLLILIIFTGMLYLSAQAILLPVLGAAGGGVTVATPYVIIGGIQYVASTMWPFTTFFSGAFLDSNTSSITSGANGSTLFTFAPAGAANSWYAVAATTSIEAEFQAGPTVAGTVDVGIWVCDTTNGHVLSWEFQQGEFLSASWTLASCAGTPSSPTNVVAYPVLNESGPIHLKISKSGTSVFNQLSWDGGQTYTTFTTITGVGTIAKAGVDLRSNNATAALIANYLSVKVQ